MLVKKPLFNFLPLCSLRLEWLDKLLLNHRGTEKPVRWAGSPTCSLLAFPQGSNWRGAERKNEIFRVTLKGLG